MTRVVLRRAHPLIRNVLKSNRHRLSERGPVIVSVLISIRNIWNDLFGASRWDAFRRWLQ